MEEQITSRDVQIYRSNYDKTKRAARVHDMRILLTGIVIGAAIFLTLVMIEMMISGTHHNMLNIGALPA